MTDFEDPGGGEALLEQERCRQRKQVEQRRQDLACLTKEPAGRRILSWLLLDLCGVLSRSYAGEQGTFFNEGRRHVGLQLIDSLEEIDPALPARLLRADDRGQATDK